MGPTQTKLKEQKLSIFSNSNITLDREMRNKEEKYQVEIINFEIEAEKETSALKGAWKCNFPTIEKIMTDRQADTPTDQQTDISYTH